MRISIHQPYAFPYPGHFRIFSEVDLHVVYDDVQHIRRGYVHRNRLRDANGRLQWLTLPLAKADFSARIMDLKFAEGGVTRMAEEMRRFPAIRRLPQDVSVALACAAGNFESYAVRLLELCAKHLGIRMVYSYSRFLNIPPEVKGHDRIIEICKKLGAKRYLNSPGGVELYNAATFAKHGIELEFLPEWNGSYASVLETIAEEQGRKAA